MPEPNAPQLIVEMRHIEKSFGAVRALLSERMGWSRVPFPPQPPRVDRAAMPYLDEPWYC